jgi:hypothetical protein
MEVTRLEIFKDHEGAYMVGVSIKNNGRFLSYPVVQVRRGDKVVANEKGLFDLYGIAEGTEEFFEFPISLPEGIRQVTLDILMGERNPGEVIGQLECPVPGRTGPKDARIKVVKAELFKDKEGKDKIRILIKNGAEFLSYPVIQARHEGQVIANEKGDFDLYGIAENAGEVFEFPISLPADKRLIKLDILVGQAGPGEVVDQVECRVSQ